MTPNLNNFEDIHRNFAMHWMLSDREREGVGRALFTREFGRTSSFFANESFIPEFRAEPAVFLPPNRSHDIQRAEELCGESYQCRYDFGMTLHREMAHFTKNYHASAINIQTVNNERVISCGILETPRFGRKSNFQFTPGARVSFECNEGFFLIGDTRRICQENGQWDVPEYGYTECLRKVFFTRRMAWITTGIVLAVMLPLIMCIVCGVYCFRKRKLKEDPDWRMPLPSRSASRASLRNTKGDGSDYDDNTIAKVRRYDASYNTHEPLAGKPDIQFEPKKMDLDEEDITSSEGGRRRMMNDDGNGDGAGAGPSMFSEDEDNTYPPPPTESPTAAYGAYSPTFSGIDRNSSFATEDNSPINVRRPAPFPPSTFSGGDPNGGQPLNQNVGLPARMDSRSTEV